MVDGMDVTVNENILKDYLPSKKQIFMYSYMLSIRCNRSTAKHKTHYKCINKY